MLTKKANTPVNLEGSGSALSELLAGIPSLISCCDRLRVSEPGLKIVRHVEGYPDSGQKSV